MGDGHTESESEVIQKESMSGYSRRCGLGVAECGPLGRLNFLTSTWW
jgi:hypothetical protein